MPPAPAAIPGTPCPASPALAPGQRLARGVARHLRAQGFAPLLEYAPTRGLRVDVIALGPKGEVWVIECKSSRADFTADAKWQGYLDWCDRFFWAVPPDFPTDILPADCGLLIADDYDAECISRGPERRLSPARRKALTADLARQAAWRLQRAIDPESLHPA
ncbi:MAG: MmcB family DNA repair protein [Rhodobacteraceae bacterium]|nr:MmcB family DNA repair protein [Paracoccaceae bacterium]